MSLIISKWFKVFIAAIFAISILYLSGLDYRQLLDFPTACFLVFGTTAITLFSFKRGVPMTIILKKSKRNCLIIGSIGLFVGLSAALGTTENIAMLPKNVAVSILMIPYTAVFYWGLDISEKHFADKGIEAVAEEAAAECMSYSGLTDRENTIVELLMKGKGNREIAEELFITESTVKKHISSIYRKLGVKSRHELVCYIGGNTIRE